MAQTRRMGMSKRREQRRKCAEVFALPFHARVTGSSRLNRLIAKVLKRAIKNRPFEQYSKTIPSSRIRLFKKNMSKRYCITIVLACVVVYFLLVAFCLSEPLDRALAGDPTLKGKGKDGAYISAIFERRQRDACQVFSPL